MRYGLDISPVGAWGDPRYVPPRLPLDEARSIIERGPIRAR
ncbi:hypothetical protein SAMN05421678_101244 [Actinopolymorpha cephalotaxi]|uniref:Uncharacterized protein n=1 Tax=Actinopolymorpha cephalotaxi TaxID=504797 RepID=A0A1I2KJB0_9ACTN|nr:hypothetical protein [Actinopolymorpha cephalotaxi]NYH81160.1 hypothetical protein [Actinopolymorpha cephalotaxi]SFF65347.1 hypothetical protein SAMN05421678_101244 [Actinopolymorpha cephalotaxi]